MRSREMSDYCVDLAYAHVGTGSSAQVVYPLFRVSTILLWCIHGTGIDVYLTFRFASEIDAVGGARFDDGAGGDNEVQRTMLGELGGVGLDDRSSFHKLTRADIFRSISDTYRIDRSIGWFRLSRCYQGVDGDQQVRKH